MKRNRAVWTVLLMFPASLVWAEDTKTAPDDEVTTLLKKVDAAAKAVKAVRYEVVAKGLGRQAFELEGTYTFSGLEGNFPQKFLFDIAVKMPGSTETQKFTGGGDGEDFFLIDHAEKKAYADIDPAVLGTRFRRASAPGLMIEFVHEAPFNDEIIATAKTLKGSKEIEGEDCHEIDVTYQNGQRATWFFSKKDLLPRKRIDPGNTEKTLKNLVADPKLGDDAYKFKLPKGYTQVDDFAP